jgi:hypothetical protein
MVLKEGLQHPAHIYQEPKNLYQDKSIKKEEKIQMLKQWKDELEQHRKALEEGMPSDGHSADESELLRNISHYIELLEHH